MSDHQAITEPGVQIEDITCPKCKGDCGGFQGVRHRGGGLRSTWLCADCGHKWPRRSIPEGAIIPEKPQPKAEVDPNAPRVLSPEAQAMADQRAAESAQALRYRRGVLDRYVHKVLSFGTFTRGDDGELTRSADAGTKRIAFMKANPVSEMFR
jgi:hypothetical protein